MTLPAGPIAARIVLLAASAASWSLAAQELDLKLAPEIVAPANSRPAPQRHEAATTRSGTAEAPQGALFLRADRLEGDNHELTASGHVELRTRDETVLADQLSYSDRQSDCARQG